MDETTATGGGAGAIVMIVYLAIVVLMCVSMWKVFVKAGQPGWAIFVPIYNAYVFLKIAGRPGWWLILMFIPLVNWIVAIIVTIDVSRRFGKSGAFAAGLIFLPFIFYPILAFGDARHTPAAA